MSTNERILKINSVLIHVKSYSIVNSIKINTFAALNYLIAAMQIGEESPGSAE